METIAPLRDMVEASRMEIMITSQVVEESQVLGTMEPMTTLLAEVMEEASHTVTTIRRQVVEAMAATTTLLTLMVVPSPGLEAMAMTRKHLLATAPRSLVRAVSV